jgi:hypothetical protein
MILNLIWRFVIEWAIRLTAELLKSAAGGQGFAQLDVTYDSATGYERYRVWASHERDGQILEVATEEAGDLPALLVQAAGGDWEALHG